MIEEGEAINDMYKIPILGLEFSFRALKFYSNVAVIIIN